MTQEQVGKGLLEKVTVIQLVKLPAFYGTRWFITVFISALLR